jgi:hypothetical protein
MNKSNDFRGDIAEAFKTLLSFSAHSVISNQ